MLIEIESAANFLSNLLRLHSDCPAPNQLERFRICVMEHLRNHYNHHWHPEMPFKGSGYRCLRINHKMDPVIAQAGRMCGMDDTALRALFPEELTLWIDPNEVSYRIGENGSICVLYDADNPEGQSGGLNSSSTKSMLRQSSPTRIHSIPSPPGSLSSQSSDSSTSSLSSPSSSPPNWYNYNGGSPVIGHSMSVSPSGLHMAKNLLLQYT